MAEEVDFDQMTSIDLNKEFMSVPNGQKQQLQPQSSGKKLVDSEIGVSSELLDSKDRKDLQAIVNSNPKSTQQLAPEKAS